ncbi:MAG: HNH endonuclease [Bacteroidales bacterium]|nr:HNH endonuclease [Bacteroidales bacterium]
MIHLNSKNIDVSAVAHLDAIQQEILREASFELQAKKASRKWDSKNSGNGRIAFQNIKETLISMCVGVEICVYCEQNEATDIEHIFPKKLYPEKAFTWDNYVLACGKCNTHHKSDKFKIFNPADSVSEEDVTPPRGTYLQPANDDSLFLNQRIEDPMDFFELDLINRQFVFIEKHPFGTREHARAKYTKELLGLNSRASLIANRKNATKYYISRLEKYVAAKNATDFPELTNAIGDDIGAIDQTAEFNDSKQIVLDSIKNDVITSSHPTVWKELIRQRQHLPKTDLLLSQAPEVLSWI